MRSKPGGARKSPIDVRHAAAILSEFEYMRQKFCRRWELEGSEVAVDGAYALDHAAVATARTGAGTCRISICRICTTA
jgi:hypothetical protein